MNLQKIEAFPVRITAILSLYYDKLDPSERILSYAEYHKMYLSGEWDPLFTEAFFEYCFSAQCIVDFLQYSCLELTGPRKTASSHIRFYNRIKYSVIADLPMLRDHLVKMANEHDYEVPKEWLETVDFITLNCRFKLTPIPQDDIPFLEAKKRLVGHY